MKIQVHRHEEGLATYVSQGLAGHQPGGDTAGLERVVKGEQLYRQSQELLSGERHVVKDISRGLSLLRESASLGHSDSVFALGFDLADSEVYPGNPEESVGYFRTSALGENWFGRFKYGRCLLDGDWSCER